MNNDRTKNLKKVNMALVRKDYNTHFNYKRYLVEDFDGESFQCDICGVGNDIKGYLYRCCICGKYFCDDCMIDVTFESSLKVSDNPQAQSGYEECEPFIEIGKGCRECVFENINVMDIGKALKKENLVISTATDEENIKE